MKPTLVSREKNAVEFTIEFTGEEFESAIIDAYRANKNKFSVPGFRKGKAPRSLIESHYGEGIFFEDAINQMFSDSYDKALDELNINVIDRPRAEFSDLKKGEGFTITIKVEAYPEFEVKGYKNVEIEKVSSEVSDEDVNKELEALRKRNSRMVAVDRPAKNGDTVLLDYSGFKGEEQFEGGTAERHSLTLGSNTFIPGFEEQLTGVSAGEEKEIKVTFPEEYHAAELAGKEVSFKCKVHEIKEEELPALDDDFAADVSEYDTLEELKKETRSKLESAALLRAENQMKNSVIEKVYAANEIDVPAVLVEDELDSIMNEFDQQLRYQGMSIDKYFEYMKKDPGEFREELREEAVKKVKTRMLVSKIAEQEGLSATDEDVENEVASLAERYRMEKEKVMEMVGQEKSGLIKNDIKIRKAVDFMFDNAVLK